MVQVPDAPWIREAENYGMPEVPPAVCPVCYTECEELFIQSGDVVGCEKCVCSVDAADWLERHMGGGWE